MCLVRPARRSRFGGEGGLPAVAGLAAKVGILRSVHALDPGPALDPHAIDRLYEASGATRWQLAREAFAAAVRRSVGHRFSPPADGAAVDAYLASLHVGDLALATACIAGSDPAWEHFIRELRPQLYLAARTVAGDDGRELADSLYGELFGLKETEGRRNSLLAHYHGRSRLLTWLRSVLVQRQIDRLRAARRLDPLPEAGSAAELAAPAPPPDPERDRLVRHAQTAVDEAIDALEPKDRLRLRLYYGQDMTLAAIGRVLGEHEATVSRKLEKARKTLRQQVGRGMAERGLAPAAIARAFELAADAPDLQLDRLLSRADDG
jgi:RNA polymerase sigma-70 factor